MTEVKLGVTLPQFTDDPRILLDAARRAEQAGLDSVWLFDHMWPLFGGKERPVLECWTALSWLAVATERIGIGTLVTRSSLRNPVLLAKMAATVAEIAPGRLTVAIGSGDEQSRDENESFGIPYYMGEDRYDQLGSTIQTVRAHLRGSGDAASPRPKDVPPVWVAGRSEAIYRLAGRFADGWNGWGGDADDFAAAAATVRAAAGGREIALTWAGVVILGSDDAEATSKLKGRDAAGRVVGGPTAVAGHLGGLVAAGATHLICTFPNASSAGPYELLAGPVRSELSRYQSR